MRAWSTSSASNAASERARSTPAQCLRGQADALLACGFFEQFYNRHRSHQGIANARSRFGRSPRRSPIPARSPAWTRVARVGSVTSP
jgi:hypothetical protein